MKIKFNKLIIDNFLSFGHAEIILNDRGYTLIKGINESPKDGAKSNGAGKSTIFSALCYALTGETIQGLSSNLHNIFTKDTMSVTLEFLVDNNEYKITRSRDINNKADLKIIANNIDKSGKGVRESEEILNKLLPELTSELIGEVIIIGQGMPHKFSNNTPAGRKDILEKLSHSDYMLEDIKNRVDNRIEKLKEKKNNIIIKKTQKETEKNILLSNIETKEKELLKYKEKPDFNKEKIELNKIIYDTENSLLNLKETLNTTELNLNIIEENYNKLKEEKNKRINDETEEFNSHNVSIKVSIAEKSSQKKLLLEEIKKLQAIKDICPMCHQKIPHVHKQDTSEQETKVSILTTELKNLEEKDTAQNRAYSLNIQDINLSFKEKEEEIDNTKKALKNTITLLNSDIITKNSLITNTKIKLNSIIKDEEIFDKEKDKINNDIIEANKKLTLLNKEILYIINEEEEVKTHQDILTKITTLVRRDFRGVLLSSVINYIDHKCKIYAKDIFGTDELNFKLNGNNLDITYLNKPLEALSGGEQQKVDLIIQFAIREMMAEYTGFTSNIIVLDEILDNLDSVGCDSILNFITNKLSDIESVFIISHHADTLNIGNDSTITVVKNPDGVSYIV